MEHEKVLFDKLHQKKISILALDDDLVIRRALQAMFEEEYTFKCVSSVAELYNVLPEMSPDLLLIDIILPDGNGLDICRNLRSDNDYKKVYIFMLTSSDDHESIEKAYEYGADDFIRKPFIPFEVSSKISNVVKTIIYEEKILQLYRHQKKFNKDLYNLTYVINQDINIENKDDLIKSILHINNFKPLCYCAAVLSANSGKEVFHHYFTDEKIGVPYKNLKNSLDIFKQDGFISESIKLKDKKNREIYCYVAPLCFNKIKEGYLILESKTIFSDETLDMITLYLDFLNILGGHIQSKNIMKDIIRKDREELSKVRGIQASLLPRFDNIKHYDIATAFIPMEEISGDFFDSYYLNEEIYQIVLCDVAGHGVASSYIGSLIRGILQSTLKETGSVKNKAKHLNNVITQALPNTYYFASLILFQLNLETGDAIFVSAGHPPCFFYNAMTKRAILYESTGPLVGMFPETNYDEVYIKMNKGDCFFMYTDGLTEAPAAEDEQMFGEKRLFRLFGNNVGLGSVEIIHSVLGEVYEHTGYSSLRDDVTIICIKRNG